MQLSAQKYTVLVFISLMLIVGTGCGKKGQLEYQTAQLKVTLGEQTTTFKKLKAESESLGNLGYYNIPQKGHLEQLNNKVKSLREETQNLTAEKEKAVKDNELLQKEMDTYRNRYLR